MPGSSKAPRRRHPDQTTRLLLDSAASEFVEYGYDRAVVSRIARRAGVTTGAIYARWANKSDIMVAALDHLFNQILPDQRIKDFGLADRPPSEIFALWGASLLRRDSAQDVLVQSFGSARNSAEVRERLQVFLNQQADQVSNLVERGKEEGRCDPGVDTVAATLLLQAIGVGTHLLLATGREDRHIPADDEWAALLVRLIDSVERPAS